MPGSTNILIIGSGVAGATIAERLLAKGIGPITMLEAGPQIVMGDYRRWLDLLTTGRRPYDNCTDSGGDFSSVGSTDVDLVASRLFARGGSTLHWGGWCLRFKPEDFHLNSGSGFGLDWPFGYDELEPYYGKAENVLQVAGDDTDGSVPRSTPFPFQSIPYTKLDGEMIAAFDALGYGYGPMPIARNGRAVNGKPACQTTGTCKYCPIGARYTADQTLDRLERDPRFELMLNTSVLRITVSAKNRAVGIEFRRSNSGETDRLEAEKIIVCAGAVETPKLLLASSDTHWPQGIGNDTDHLGRHLFVHPLLFARGTKPSNPLRLQHELDFPTLCSRHFDTPDEQSRGKLFFFLPPVAPLLNVGGLIKSGQSVADIKRVADGPHRIELQGFMEEFPYDTNRISLGHDTTSLGLPSTRVEFNGGLGGQDQLNSNLNRMQNVLSQMGYKDLEFRGLRPPCRPCVRHMPHGRLGGRRSDGAGLASPWRRESLPLLECRISVGCCRQSDFDPRRSRASACRKLFEQQVTPTPGCIRFPVTPCAKFLLSRSVLP